jgi:UDPglucose--hexose-1-phosphate uridylyltransferase
MSELRVSADGHGSSRASDPDRCVTKTEHRLADGREIVFYDDRPGPARDVDDTRELARTHTSSELRYDRVVDEWVIVASHRQGRTHLPPADQCPLCPSVDGNATEIPASEYDVVVFENRFPSLTTAARVPEASSDDGVGAIREPGLGRCEVVCFTSDHDASFASLSSRRARTVIDAWADRTAELSRVDGVEQVFPFENRGEAIGVTLHHPHGQIYAYPFVTPRTRRMIESAETYLHRTGRNLFADVIADEERTRTRVVTSSTHWLAFVPAAARWPYEVHLFPRRQVGDLTELTGAERDDLAEVYLDVLGRLDRVHDAPMPYIAAWHQAPVRHARELAWLHLQLASVRRAPGKLKHLAGSEAAMGVFINDIAPEVAAATLRQA